MNQSDEMTSRRVAVCLVFTCFPPRHAALEKKMLFDLLFFRAVIRLSASMRALFIIFDFKDFFLGWLRFAILDRCILLHYVWEDGAEHQVGQREPWALAYSFLDIIYLEHFID